MVQAQLFDAPPPLPEGMRYEEGFLTAEEEASLIAHIARLPLHAARYKAYTARRRVVSYGGSYDFERNRLKPGAPMAAFLHPLRDRVAAWSGHAPDDFQHALVAEYSPGTPLGWHRDVPDFEDVVGISLASACRMRLRPYPPPANPREGVMALELAPRSIYLLRGPARWAWQHQIPPTPALRYSITFRSLRRTRA